MGISEFTSKVIGDKRRWRWYKVRTRALPRTAASQSRASSGTRCTSPRPFWPPGASAGDALVARCGPGDLLDRDARVRVARRSRSTPGGCSSSRVGTREVGGRWWRGGVECGCQVLGPSRRSEESRTVQRPVRLRAPDRGETCRRHPPLGDQSLDTCLYDAADTLRGLRGAKYRVPGRRRNVDRCCRRTRSRVRSSTAAS